MAAQQHEASPDVVEIGQADLARRGLARAKHGAQWTPGLMTVVCLFDSAPLRT